MRGKIELLPWCHSLPLWVHVPNVGLQISISIFRNFNTSRTRLGHSISLEMPPEMNKFSWHSNIIPVLNRILPWIKAKPKTSLYLWCFFFTLYWNLGWHVDWKRSLLWLSSASKVQLSTFPRGLNWAQKPQSNSLLLNGTFQPFLCSAINHASCLLGSFPCLWLLGEFLLDGNYVPNSYSFAL